MNLPPDLSVPEVREAYEGLKTTCSMLNSSGIPADAIVSALCVLMLDKAEGLHTMHTTCSDLHMLQHTTNLVHVRFHHAVSGGGTHG